MGKSARTRSPRQERLVQGRNADLVEGFVEERLNEQAARPRLGDAAGPQIEQGLLVDVARSRPVAAFHVVGVNL
jgi:hypothetical protein